MLKLVEVGCAFQNAFSQPHKLIVTHPAGVQLGNVVIEILRGKVVGSTHAVCHHAKLCHVVLDSLWKKEDNCSRMDVTMPREHFTMQNILMISNIRRLSLLLCLLDEVLETAFDSTLQLLY